jgi:L-aspartate oxidase
MAALTSDDAVAQNRDRLRYALWDHVGIRRSRTGLCLAQRVIRHVMHESADLYRRFKLTAGLLELRNLALVADLIVRSALARQECRGAHFVSDYAERDCATPPSDTVLQLEE